MPVGAHVDATATRCCLPRARTGDTAAGQRLTPTPSNWQADLMALPDLDVARVRRWCDARVPERARHQVRVECDVALRHLTIVERRAPWCDDGSEWTTLPIARLRYAAVDRTWTLFSRDRNLRFHVYDLIKPSRNVDDILAEIDRDPINIFWG